jgi:hypothetical protein
MDIGNFGLQVDLTGVSPKKKVRKSHAGLDALRTRRVVSWLRLAFKWVPALVAKG